MSEMTPEPHDEDVPPFFHDPDADDAPEPVKPTQHLEEEDEGEAKDEAE
jgi:hypothetical protein